MSYRSTMNKANAKANEIMEIVGKVFAGLLVAAALFVAAWLVWLVWAASTGNLPS